MTGESHAPYTTASIKITKMDAVHRQINAAIRMWFANEDPVAIHTVVAAAHELLHTLFKRAGFKGMLFDSPAIKDKSRAEFAKAVKRPATFFKHSQRDPDAILEFDPAVNGLLLMYCARGLDQMNERKTIELVAFGWWLWLHEPDLYPPAAGHGNVPSNLLENLRRIDRPEWLEHCRKLAEIGFLPGFNAP
jgi:hypothetical protein